MLGAMSSHGMVASMTVASATDGEVFLAYLDHLLCPYLRLGQGIASVRRGSVLGHMRRDPALPKPCDKLLLLIQLAGSQRGAGRHYQPVAIRAMIMCPR